MRVASPYHESAKESLNLYRVLEPHTWAKVVGRVHGANFGAIYGRTKALGVRSITLPPGHTWRTYVKFLLATLPAPMRQNYIEKFKTSIKFWWRRGGVVNDEALKELILKIKEALVSVLPVTLIVFILGNISTISILPVPSNVTS